jgi:bifunctional DNase/RNase
MSSKKLELEIVALSHSVTQSHSYAVVLGEVNGVRKLPIVIGGFEAQAIAVALENMQPTRPLTHDLIKNLMTAFDVKLVEVLIHRIHEGIFYAKLVCQSPTETIEIDSRTSDAIAIGVRFNSPIYTLSSILNNVAGTENSSDEVQEELDYDPDIEEDEEIENLELENLEEQLKEAILNEDYELASKLRDEIKKRP